jgi:hypothetical protein
VQVEKGGQYAIRLRLSKAEHLGSGWLLGAMLLRYPGMLIQHIEEQGDQMVLVRFSWRGGPGLVQAGDTVSPAVEGLLMPEEALPVGEVETAMVLAAPMDAVERADWGGARLLLACGLLAGTWYLVRRIGQ